MDVIAVQIHDMVMNEFLPKAGVRDLKISEEIRKLGVHEFIGEVPDLDTLTAKVQELISRNLTLNETIGIVMELYEWMRTKANSEVDFRALKSIGESLQNKAKVKVVIPRIFSYVNLCFPYHLHHTTLAIIGVCRLVP